MRICCTVLALALLTSTSSYADQTIDVLFVFDSRAAVIIPDKQSWMNIQVAAVNLALQQSGRAELRFNGSVRLTAIPYNSFGRSADQHISWMRGSGSQLLESVRGLNDVIIMVAEFIQGNDCGIASPLRDKISAENRNVAQYAVVGLQGCDEPPGNVLAHELGHLLYLEHELQRDSNNFILLDGDWPAFPSGSTSVNKPAKKNHGWWEGPRADNGQRSIMASVTDDQFTFRRFTNGESPYDGTYENTTDVLGIGFPFIGSWDAVSRYRQPAPQACNITYEFVGCNGRVPVGILTATLPNYEVSNAKYSVKVGSGGWVDIFEGILGCFGITAQRYMTARAILTTAFGVSQCTVSVPYPRCDGGIQPF